MVKDLKITSIEKVEILGSKVIITHTNEPGFRRTLEVSRDMPIGEVLEELYFSYSNIHNCGEAFEKESKQFQKENIYLRSQLCEAEHHLRAQQLEYQRNLEYVKKQVLERISIGLRNNMNIVSRSTEPSGKCE